MKRVWQVFLILTLLLSGSAFTRTPGHQYGATGGGPILQDPRPAVPDYDNKIYMPLVQRPIIYAVTGKVVSAANVPLSGATITDSQGHTTVTDANGNFGFYLPSGNYALTATLAGYLFSPSVAEIQVMEPTSVPDFNAVAACSNVILNGGFEVNANWTLSPEDADEYPATYNGAAAKSGVRSLQVGLPSTLGINRYSYSWARQTVVLPATTTSAAMRVWLLLSSQDTSQVALPERPKPQSGENLQAMTLASDVQYINVLDAAGNLIETIFWLRAGSPSWQAYDFNLAKFAGQTVQIEFGVYNDGISGPTWMYVDDVSLDLCTSDVVPTVTPTSTTVPPGCTNQVLDSSFEAQSNAWGIPNTEFWASFSKSQAHTGIWSMRTGIPDISFNNRYSYSDAYQVIDVPDDATSITLDMWVWRKSTSDINTASDNPVPLGEVMAQAAAPQIGQKFEPTQLSGDAQYVLILDQYGEIMDIPLWERGVEREWRSFHVPLGLNKYRGETIRIQFGTYNDGVGGVTSMFVDDLTLVTCGDGSITPTATVPPPTGCYEELGNRFFEHNKFWEIPITEYSAGYSTAFYFSPERSMRTGIYYKSHNTFSYSDFRQEVYIPKNVTSATFSLWIYTRSTEVSAALTDEGETLDEQMDTLTTAGNDLQYILVLDENGYILDTLWSKLVNNQTWQQKIYNLKPYAGQWINIQIGTYNDGWNGVTSMYVDDASLNICQ